MDTLNTEHLMTNMSNDDYEEAEEELIPLIDQLEQLEDGVSRGIVSQSNLPRGVIKKNLTTINILPQ